MTTFKRTTILLTDAQILGLKVASDNDPDGLAVAQLIRVAINEFLARRARQK
jgi:hypothetical protein